jgi:thiol-disulfide isomerase/thioredoxin
MKITDIFFNKIYAPYKRYVLIISLLIIFITIGVLSYIRYAVPMIKDKDQKNISNANRRIQTADIYFFHADWCPHCKKALPIWHEFVSNFDQTNKNGFIINCIQGSKGIDCSSTNDAKTMETIQKFNVEHYPTIKMVKDDASIDYDAKITKDNLTKFIETVL